MVGRFEFRQIETEQAEATVSAWRKQVEQLGDLINPVYYRMVFDWVLKVTSDKRDSDNYAYGLFKVGGDPLVAHAILDVTHAGKKSEAPWLKVLSLYVSPKYDAESEMCSAELALITVQSIIEAFDLTADRHPSDSLKICSASNALDRGFLRGMVAVLSDHGISASMSGNWLICKKPGS